MSSPSLAAAEQETAALERRLLDAKRRLALLKAQSTTSHDDAPQWLAPDSSPATLQAAAGASLATPLSLVSSSYLHSLLLLSDSALPLGSFAFSSGLESFLAHRPKPAHTLASFNHFLALSLASLTSTALPYVVSAYCYPHLLDDLDNDFDASTICSVARRASIKQGRALIAVWERSFRPHAFAPGREPHIDRDASQASIQSFCTAMKTGSESDLYSPNGHLAPLFGVLCAILRVPLPHALYLFLMNHTKTLVSAGIRSSVLGPYQAQGILASENLKARISGLLQDELAQTEMLPNMGEEHQRHRTAAAGQSVPMLDLWGGRHEIIYSRIFNS